MPPPEFVINGHLLTNRFGRWPSFHDAEVVRLAFLRDVDDSPATTLLIHTWNMIAEVDDRGYIRREKHTLVELRAACVFDSEWRGFNHQNVILDLNFARCTFEGAPAVRLDMSTSHGLSGYLISRSIEVVSVSPCDESGNPENSG